MLHHNANATQGYMRPDTHMGRPVAREEREREREDRGDMEAQAGDSMPKRRCWMETGYKGALSTVLVLGILMILTRTPWATSRSSRQLQTTELQLEDCPVCFDYKYSKNGGTAGEEKDVLDIDCVDKCSLHDCDGTQDKDGNTIKNGCGCTKTCWTKEEFMTEELNLLGQTFHENSLATDENGNPTGVKKNMFIVSYDKDQWKEVWGDLEEYEEIIEGNIVETQENGYGPGNSEFFTEVAKNLNDDTKLKPSGHTFTEAQVARVIGTRYNFSSNLHAHAFEGMGEWDADNLQWSLKTWD